MKITNVILSSLMALALCVSAQNEDKYSHGEIVYPPGQYDQMNQELRDFIHQELGNYKQIIVKEKEGISQAQLLFISAESGEAEETVFANYIPISMIKDMLQQNGFLLDQEQVEKVHEQQQKKLEGEL